MLYKQGNSLIRGPPDVVAQIHAMLGGPRFACSPPHTLAFQIGGKFFPVDPRDFVSEVRLGDPDLCAANVMPTDVPVLGGSGYLYSWNLGDPFLKGWVGFSSLRVVRYGGGCPAYECRGHNAGQSCTPVRLGISAGLVDRYPHRGECYLDLGCGVSNMIRISYGCIRRRNLRASEMNALFLNVTHFLPLVDFSVLAAFHYGSLTRPSQNPPRVGLLSTVDPNAGKQLCDDKHQAEREHEGYPSRSLPSLPLLRSFTPLPGVASDCRTGTCVAPTCPGYRGWGCTPRRATDRNAERHLGNIYKRRFRGRADRCRYLECSLGWPCDMGDMEDHRVM